MVSVFAFGGFGLFRVVSFGLSLKFMGFFGVVVGGSCLLLLLWASVSVVVLVVVGGVGLRSYSSFAGVNKKSFLWSAFNNLNCLFTCFSL